MRSIRALIAALIWIGVIHAQSADATARARTLFDSNAGATALSLTLAPEAVLSLRAAPRQWVRAELRCAGDAEAIAVGVKLKGSAGSFRDFDDKPGFTVDVRRFAKSAPDFHGILRFHLNNAVQDPTYLHEYLAHEIFRRAGYPAARVSHATLTVNGRRMGLYVVKEAYDRAFLDRSFGTSSGNLYDGGANGDVDQEIERDMGDGPEDRSDLRAVAAACAEADIERRREALERTVDIDRMLTFMALECLIGHWDGYTLNPNNFRIWFDPRSGKAVFIAHGMDQILGDPHAGLFGPASGKVAAAVLSVPAWRAAYLERVKKLAAIFADVEGLAAVVRRGADHLRPLWTRSTPRAELRDWRAAVRDLGRRIAERATGIAEEIARTPDRPFDTEKDGGSLAHVRFQERSQCEDIVFASLRDGTDLKITAGTCGRCIGSWRTPLILSRGRYRLISSMTLAGVDAFRDGPGAGAGIRISGAHREDVHEGDAAGLETTFDFEIEEAEREIAIVLELRARAGSVIFHLDRTRLIRRD